LLYDYLHVVGLSLKNPKIFITETPYLINRFSFFSLKSFIIRTFHLTLLINDLKKRLKLKKTKTKKKNKSIFFTPLKLTRTYLIYNKLSSVTRYTKHRVNSLCEFKNLVRIKSFLVISVFPELISYKKSLGSRMGKGRGTLKIFYFQIPQMQVIITLLNVNNTFCYYLLTKLQKKYCPLLYYRYVVLKKNLP
jgi:ribosomal protein L16/L10AE